MKKRILYLHRTQGKGAEGSHIRGMVDAFREDGYHVDIAGPPGIDPYSKNKSTSSVDAAKPSLLKLLWEKLSAVMPQIVFEAMELAYNIHAYPRIRKILYQHEFYFIYERYALNTFYGASLARKRAIPLVIEVNDATVIERSRPLVLRRLAEKFERKVLQQASLIVTISNTFKELLVKGHDISVDKILVLPNAVNPHDYILDPKRRIKREILGIRENQIVLGCAGAFVPWHGLAFMINALHEIILAKDLFVLFIGDGPVRGDIEALADKYNISDNLLFTGFIDANKVPYYLDLIDICVIPDSNNHCSPMKLFEYMAIRKAIILPNDYKPLLEVITDNREGLFFDRLNADSMHNCVVSLIRDKAQVKRLGEYAHKTLIAKYTWQNNVERFLTCIGNLLLVNNEKRL